jgi:excisionase family DNA binding protein
LYQSVRQVADRLKVHPRTLRRLIRDGRLDAVKVGKEWRIPQEAMERLLGPGAAEPAEPLFMTAGEFLRLPETNLPVQLIKGWVVRDPAPFVPHQILVGRLHLLLYRGIVEPGQGVVLLAPTDVVLSGDTVLQPDLLAVARNRSSIIGRRVEGPPDLVVEVEAESTRERDLTAKRMLYARHGVKEFWFVSGTRRLVFQLSDPADDDYRSRSVRELPASVTSVAFSSFSISLADLFEE